MNEPQSSNAMGKIFVSHASADSALVDEFVSRILDNGCGLSEEQIFYSSSRDMGVPSGYNLLSYVQQEVGDADLVIAIISPMFQSRPVCVAELGAAWSRTGNLFPIAVPGMPRTDMEGVMEGVTVYHLDDREALDELAGRVAEATNVTRSALSWNKAKERWLAEVGSLAAALKIPDEISPADHAKLESELGGTRAALTDALTEKRALEETIRRYREADTHEKRREALIPTADVERFEHFRKAAADALKRLDPIVKDVMRHEMTEGPMPRPNAFDDARADAARDAEQAGFLEESDGFLGANSSIRVVRQAQEAIAELQSLLEEGGLSEEFYDWFDETYGAPADLRLGLVWDELLN
jgi:hypothetical protein